MGFLENLQTRAEVVRRIRAFFDARGFLEVETPVRIAAPAPEPHIDCPAVIAAPQVAQLKQVDFLRASPELQMKKLLAAGLTKIYQIGPCFREGERGRRHNPEFTMLEWYRAYADYTAIQADMTELVTEILGLDPATFTTLTVREAYQRWAGWDPWVEFDADRFDYDMAVKIEPQLPQSPVYLTDYPPAAASLAKMRGEVAERWELYVQGIELANAFTELVNPTEQRERFVRARAERCALGETDYPLDEDFLEMLAAMPPAGGVALGVDRLVMLACSASALADCRVL